MPVEDAGTGSVESCAICGLETVEVDGRDVCSNPHCYGRDPLLQWHTTAAAAADRPPAQVIDSAEAAARDLAAALRQRRIGRITVTAGADGYAVTLQNHPSAFIHFRWDVTGELQVHCAFDERPPAPVAYDASDSGISELADLVYDQVSARRKRPPRQ